MLTLTLTDTNGCTCMALQATQSALINVCVFNERLVLARQVYVETRAMGLRPHLHAFNSLINAYARNFRLGDVVSSQGRNEGPPLLLFKVLKKWNAA